MTTAVVLMAYGSPDRLEDVPAYYADIRGGRPVAQELLDDLVGRYRRLGIEESNPLNELTEATRAALEAELGLPVFTGMRHWQPRIAEAVERESAVRAALESLKPQARQLVSLAFFRGLTQQEIAETCGLPLGTVKATLFRAYQQMRACLAASGLEPEHE